MLSHGLAFTVHNDDDAEPLQFVSSNPANLYRRLECRCAGVLVDDITDYNRLANLMTVYQSTGKRLQTATLGFGTKENMFKNAADGVNSVTPRSSDPRSTSLRQSGPTRPSEWS